MVGEVIVVCRSLPKRYGFFRMKLSIIMPVYNVERYLRECLDSLLSQTFVDWELICVDDGSTDGSGRILDEYAVRDSRLRPIHQANAKVHAARNRALDLAQGEWVGFLDPDDLIAPRWLETAMKCAKEDVDLVRQSCISGKVRPNGFTSVDPADAAVTYIVGENVPQWGWRTFSSSGFLWLCFMRRELIGDLRFLPEINCKEDGIFLLELVPRLKKVVQTSFAGYFYRTVSGSLSVRRHVARQTTSFLKAYLSLWESQREWASENGIAALVRSRLHFGAVSDICDWASKRDIRDKQDEKDIRCQYLALKKADAIPDRGWCGGRSRFRIPFAIWERTGWIAPLSFVGKSFLAAGNILRRIGLRKCRV